MCGIAGILNLDHGEPISESEIGSMLGAIRHRGPDQFGVYLDHQVGLGNARLSIIDLSSGQQPIANEDGTLWIVFNGEIFNYVELRPELQALGHQFETETDTEVLLHLYEEFGPQCLERLNGQFAFAIWDTRKRSLFLARDRLGVRPLFYTRAGGRLLFASAIKALRTQPGIGLEIDPVALDQTFTFWAPLSPRTAFRNVFELPPGHYLVAQDGQVRVRGYWQLDFSLDEAECLPGGRPPDVEAYAEELAALLIDAVRIRLRADVEVGAYLSGGLDSSLIAALVRNFTSNELRTFSIAFSDAAFDESKFQRQMAEFLGTEHQVLPVAASDIGRVFPEVIWHAETPLLRTAPAPMYLLSELVRDRQCKVVLTGEGADEFLGGYDIFKEAKIRRFWARKPDSKWRSLPLQRLYPDISGLSQTGASLLTAFFSEGLTQVDRPEYSHAIRWRNSRRTRRFLSEEVLGRSSLPVGEMLADQLPARFGEWDPLAKAQCLEIKMFLSQYLLSSQGDRMAMAHSVEGRFPFLDRRVVEFCTRLPARLKLRGLTEKYLLKQLGKRWLPAAIWQRPKRPYRAPVHRSFFAARSADYARELLSPEELQRSGLFKPAVVAQLVRKLEAGKALGETDDMALVGILSTQLLHHQFVANYNLPPTLSAADDVKVCRGPGASPQTKPHEIHQEHTRH